MELKTTRIRGNDKDEIIVLPLGDIQYTGKGGSTVRALLKDYVARGLDLGAYFVGMGDYIDFASPSNRARLASANLYDTAKGVIDEAAHNLNLELYEDVLKPTKGRWLGMLEGHHFHQYQSGITSDQELCEMLGAPFLGTCGYVRLAIETKWKGGLSFVLWVHHGAGGGMTAGSPLLRLERMANHWDADVFLIGHQSKLVSAPIERIYPVWDGNGLPSLKHRKILLACTGSFSRGYIPQNRQGNVPRGDYVEQKMLTPTALGGVVVRFSWKRTQKTIKGQRQIDLVKDITIEF